MCTYGVYVGDSVGKSVGTLDALGLDDEVIVGIFDSVGSGVTALAEG